MNGSIICINYTVILPNTLNKNVTVKSPIKIEISKYNNLYIITYYSANFIFLPNLRQWTGITEQLVKRHLTTTST